METHVEGRHADSPYIEMIWRGQAGSHYAPTCPADAGWHVLVMNYQGQSHVYLEGPLTHALDKTQPEGMEWLVIKFKLGMFMPFLPVQKFRDATVNLPQSIRQSFWLNGTAWQLPAFENAETFVHRLVREEMLVCEPLVTAVLNQHPHDYSARTVRRRFLQSTGLTPKTVQQIQRAKQAAALLEQGCSILDTVFALGYADQPHLTRALRHYIGRTPAQIAAMRSMNF